jgi:hypothetical protein
MIGASDLAHMVDVVGNITTVAFGRPLTPALNVEIYTATLLSRFDRSSDAETRHRARAGHDQNR